MKTRIGLLLCFGLMLTSCSKKNHLEDRLTPNLIDFFEVQLGADFNREKDKITITKIDTLTEKGRLNFKAIELKRQLEEEGIPRYERLKDDLAFFTQQYAQDPTQTNQDQLALVKDTCADMEGDIQELKGIIEETMQQRLTADSIQFRAYRVHGFFTYTSKKEGNQDVKFNVIMDDQYKVIPVEDIVSY